MEIENKNLDIVKFKFKKEKEDINLDLKSPNFSDFVKNLIYKNLDVVAENIDISCDNDDIDTEALKNIVIEVNLLYKAQLSDFYSNIKKDINTYYGDNDILAEKIEDYIKSSMEENDVSVSDSEN